MPGVLRGVEPALLAILRQVGRRELFRQGTAIPLPALSSGPLAIANGRLTLARVLVNGPTLPIAPILAGDIFCPRALHPIVHANSLLLAEEETIGYSVSAEYLTAVRRDHPDLGAALDEQVNGLLQRLQAETEAVLRSLREL